MQKLYLILCIIGFSFYCHAQKIQVISEDAQLPISGVAVYNLDKSKNGITDFDGGVDISSFEASEIIYFQHLGHTTVSFPKNEIGTIVEMQEASNTLEEIVLSVAKFGQSRKEVPQQIVSVTSKDIAFRNPQTAADLLETSGQVYVQKSQLGGGSPLIRGFSTNRLLISVDGTRFNTAIFRGGNVQNVISIDPFTIDRTEVILGPGSVVYGSDAVGGVMNFYTKNPRFSFEEGVDISGNAVGRYATASNEKTGHFDFNVGMKEWAFLTSVTISDFDDLRMGSNGPDDYLRREFVETIDGVDVVTQNDDPEVQRFTGYQQLNLMQKIRYAPSNTWDVNLGLFYSTTSDFPRYDRLIRRTEGQLRSAEWFYGPQEWMSGNLQISHQQDGVALFDDSKITLNYQRFKESRNDRDFGEVLLFETDEMVQAWNGALDFTKKLGNNQLFYGAEYVFNEVGSEGTVTNINSGDVSNTASRYPDGSTWQSLAVYTSLKSKFSEEVSFQGGLRYNHVVLNADFTENNRFYNFPFDEANIDTGAFTGSAGITWQPSETISWRLNFGTAFRAPNVDDVGKIFDSEPGSVVVPNPDVKPEYAYNGELGTRFNFGSHVTIDVAAYYTILEDALVRRDFDLNGETIIDFQGEPSQVQAIQNAGRAEVYGFEAGMEVKFSEFWKFTSQFNITDGFTIEEEEQEVPIRHAAPPFGNSRLIFQKKKWKFDAFVNYNGQFSFEDLAPSQQNNAFLYALDENGNPFSPSWYTLNLAAQYQITKALGINASLENITDQRYRPYSSGIAAAGRNLIVSASYKF